jgi:nitrate reductase beta subunit
MAAMRRFMRAADVDGRVDTAIATEVGMEPAEMEAMFRMVAISDYDDRYVVPKRHGELTPDAYAAQGSCGVDFVDGAPVPPEPAPDPDFDLRDHLVIRNGGDGEPG